MVVEAERTAPAFVSALLASDEDAKAILSLEHPDYAANRADWQVLIDAFEGAGGFQDGSYLWPYPRENSADFTKRQAMARYHNFVEPLVDLYARFLFTQGVNRTSNSEEYNTWTQDVDGAGSTLEDVLRRAVSFALAASHSGILVDKTPDVASGPSKADERARVIATVFASTAIPDWRIDRDVLQAVKLREAASLPTITEEIADGDEAKQYLFWDTEGWARFDSAGHLLSFDVPDLGLVPFVTIRPKPRYSSSLVSRSLIGHPNIPRALLNRASEEDQVIRDQAFSVLTVEVPADGNAEQAKADLGTEIGTTRALVVRGKIDFKTPSQDVATGIRENIAYLVQEMFRAAHVRFKNDSLAPESGASLRLQYTELNEMLQGLAKGLALAERQIARCWFAWMAPTKEQAQANFEAAEVEAIYPTEFFLDDLMTDLEAWGEAVRMKLGETMTRRIKKKAVRRIDPEMPAAELEQIDAEIDAMTADDLMPPAPLDTGDPEAVAITKAEQELNADAA